MNTTYNPLVEDYSVDNSDVNISYEELFIELDELDSEEEHNSKETLFRGKRIELLQELRTHTKVTENAIDSTTQDVDETEKNHNVICYDGKEYTRHRFLKEYFKDVYMKYPCKVQFNNDNVFLLSSTQRAKLQYDILTQHFGLVEVDRDDKDSLMEFCAKQNNQTMQKWHDRMLWTNGFEKMITFGTTLEVRSYTANGTKVYVKTVKPFCYRKKIDLENNKAIFTGIERTWEQWTNGIISCVDFRRAELKIKYGDKKALQRNDRICIRSLYYQNYTYLTLPKKEGDILRKFMNDYIVTGSAVLDDKLKDKLIPNSDKSFTIDFKLDVQIVKQHDNTEHNQDMGRKRVMETFSRLLGDVWTTQEIYSQGFNKGNLERFVKYGLIKRVKRGHYIRV